MLRDLVQCLCVTDVEAEPNERELIAQTTQAVD